MPERPSTSDLHEDYLVYTAHDSGTDFSAIDTYFLPDSILIIGNNDRTEYWKDDDALTIIDARGRPDGQRRLHAQR